MSEYNSNSGIIIRVYGLLINEKAEVLLSDEFRFNTLMTKFPGGGMEFGEGPEECLLRESIEEFGQSVKIISHFYTTGFFQKAMFYDNHQLISIYYKIRTAGEITFPVSDKPFDFSQEKEGAQSFRWKKIDELKEDHLSFPIDKYVAKKLSKEHFSL